MQCSCRSWISTTIKAKAKAQKKAAGKKRNAAQALEEGAPGEHANAQQAAKGTGADLFAQLGVEMPSSPEQQVKLLQDLLKEEAKLDECIENAKKSVEKPQQVPLTKLSSDEERNAKNFRAKVMQEAIEAAKKFDSSSGGGDASKSDSAFGFQEALLHAESTGARDLIVKKKLNKTDEAKLVLQLGKHLLK